MGIDNEKIDRAVDEALEAAKGVAAEVGGAIAEGDARDSNAERSDKPAESIDANAEASADEAGDEDVDGEAEASPKRNMTRRGALVGVPAFLLGLLMWKPQTAWGYSENDLGFTANWGGQANYSWNYPITFNQIGNAADRGGTMYYGFSTDAVTPWFEWAMVDGQYLGAALYMKVKCDFATELYYHLNCSIAVACISYCDYGSSGYWGWYYTSGGDCILELYLKKDGGAWQYAKSQGSKGREDLGYAVDMNCDWNNRGSVGHTIYKGPSGSLYSSKHQWTNFVEFGDEADHTFSVWVRRNGTLNKNRAEKLEIELGAGFYDWTIDWYSNKRSIGKNYCANSSTTNRADGQAVYASTGYIPLTQQNFVLSSTKALTGRIMTIAPAAQTGKRLDTTGGDCKSGNALCCWNDTNTTNQNWAISCNTDNNRFGTSSLHPVNGDTDYWLDLYGSEQYADFDFPGDPTAETMRKAQVWSGNGTMNQSFWLYRSTGNNFIVFADASGHCLDVYGGCKENDETSSGEVQNVVQFHVDPSNLAGEWSNESHHWIFNDVFYKLRDGKTLEVSGLDESTNAPVVNHQISVDVASCTWPCQHPNSSKSGLYYEYAWGAYDINDDLSWINDEVVVWGWFSSSYWGKLDDEMYGHSLIGIPDSGKHTYMCGLHLRVDGSSFDGDIVYSMRRYDTGEMSEERTGSDSAFIGYEKAADLRFTGFCAHLTGDLAEKYSLRYHVYGDLAGWGSWAEDGEEASAGTGPDWIQAISIRVEPKTIDGQGFGSATSKFTVSEGLVGKKLAFFSRAVCTGLYYPYRGLVAAQVGTEPVRMEGVRLQLWVDGERFNPSGVLETIQFEYGETIAVDPAWTAEAKTFNDRDKTCSGFISWYYDKECANLWTDGVVSAKGVGDSNSILNLYARNKVIVDYKPTTHAQTVASGRDLYRDQAKSTQGSVGDVPVTYHGYVHDMMEAKLPEFTKLWYTDAGADRVLTCAQELYTRDYKNGAKPSVTVKPGKHPVTKTFTYYVDWDDSPYDGFIGR